MNGASLLAHPLCRPLALTTAAVALAAGLAYAGDQARQAGLAERDRAAQRLSHAQARLRQKEQDRTELHQHADLFQRLKAKGRIGKPRLLEWSESLHRAHRRVAPAKMEYQFASAEGRAKDPDAAFHKVAMKLRLQVLHERDFLHFLARLQEEAQALVLLRRCRLARQDPAVSEPSGALHADCDLDWATAMVDSGQS